MIWKDSASEELLVMKPIEGQYFVFDRKSAQSNKFFFFDRETEESYKYLSNWDT